MQRPTCYFIDYFVSASIFNVKFQVLTAASMLFRELFWFILPTRHYNPEDSSERLFLMFEKWVDGLLRSDKDTLTH
jgi:hypothetical protein